MVNRKVKCKLYVSTTADVGPADHKSLLRWMFHWINGSNLCVKEVDVGMFKLKSVWFSQDWDLTFRPVYFDAFKMYPCVGSEREEDDAAVTED